MKKEIIQVIGFLAPVIIVLNKKRLTRFIKDGILVKFLFKRTSILFRVNEQGELRSILLAGFPVNDRGRKVVIVRSEDPSQSSPLTEEQIKKLDGLYLCLCNEALSKTEIVIRTYATLLELTEEQLEAFRGYLF